MKTWVCLAISCLAILTGCATDKIPASDRKVMEAAMHDFFTAYKQVTDDLTALKEDPIKAGFSSALSDTFQEWADKLGAVDISKCPEDFRLAFVKYRQEDRALVNKNR